MASPEDEDTKQCRICLALDCDDLRPLVQPCACRGSAKWIHIACLEEWRRKSPKEDAAYRCGQCNEEYRDTLSIELLTARLEAEYSLAWPGQAWPGLYSLLPGQASAHTYSTLASELHVQGRYVEAEPLCRELLKWCRETLRNRHPSTLASVSNLGTLLMATRVTSPPRSHCYARRWRGSV